MGSHLRLPSDMIGTDDGGGVRIKGTLQQRQLARALRRLREEAGLTLEEAAPKLDWSTSKLGRIETAQEGVDVHGVRSMLDLYNVGGAQWTADPDLESALQCDSAESGERFVDRVEVEALRMVADLADLLHPVAVHIVLRVLRIAQGAHQLGETPRATAVFGRSGAAAGHTVRVGQRRVGPID